MTQRFPPSARVLRGADYKRCFATGARHGSRFFRLHHLLPQLPASVPGSHEPDSDGTNTTVACSAPPSEPTSAPADTAPARLGLAVSRKFEKRAVGRNRIKRLARERFRLLRSSLQPGDYVIVPRREAAAAANTELCRDLDRLLQRAGALKGADPQGTMPLLGDRSGNGKVAASDGPAA